MIFAGNLIHAHTHARAQTHTEHTTYNMQHIQHIIYYTQQFAMRLIFKNYSPSEVGKANFRPFLGAMFLI